MKASTTIVLRHLLESALSDLNSGNCNIQDEEGLTLIESMRGILYPTPKLEVCNISQVSEILNLSQPTIRKYIKEGIIPAPIKVSGFTEKVWDREVINNLNLNSMACKGKGKGKGRGKGGSC